MTPAETCLISNNARATLKDLLKLTLADLCWKKVLKIDVREEFTAPMDPIDVYKYVVVGSHFEDYQPKDHEWVFLRPYQHSPDIEILFKDLIKMAFQNARGRKHYVYDILFANRDLRSKFQQGLFKRLFGMVSLNEEGKSTKGSIDSAIRKLEKELRS